MAGVVRRYGKKLSTATSGGDSKESPTLQAQQLFPSSGTTPSEGLANLTVKKTKITDFFYKDIGPSASPDIPTNLLKPPRIQEAKIARLSTQLYLDFGQKNLAATSCPECGLTYDPSFAEDVRRHGKEHERQRAVFQAAYYKEICSWQELSKNGHLLLIVRSPGAHQVEQLCHRVNQIMGAAEQSTEEIRGLDIYLQCRDEKVVGFLSLERASKGVLTSEYTGTRHNVEVLAGVSRVWTAPELRRQGVAMILLKSLRRCSHTNAIQCTNACLIPPIKVAFSQLTAAGKGLANSYLGLGSASCIYVTYK